MEKDITISVKNISKTFRIPHEKITSIKGAVTNAFRSGGYEEFKALDDVSFEVKKGEFFGIIGRNGSGKSTLLKILAGIYQPDTPKKKKGVHPVKSRLLSGNLTGVKINGMISPFLELGIGFNPELSGRDNVYLNATVLGMTKKQIDEKFDSIVKFSELERFIDQKLKNYSSGMQVRLAFSVSIHANRDILLMDEVLAVGDSNFQSKCLEEFNKYRDMGRTVIIVTHDILVVQRYCDRAMLLRDGKIVKIGSADDVGDIYISQNISDNAKKMQDDDSLDKEDGKRRHKNNVIQCGAIRKVMFEKIELLDSNEKKLSLVKYDQPVILRLVIVANDNVKNLAFGYHIRDSSGLDIVYSDNIIENFKFTNLKKGQQYIIDWKFKMSLIQGSYKIACALSIPIDLKKSIVDMCDFVGSAVNFQVYPREGSFLYGKVHLDNNINIINHENIN